MKSYHDIASDGGSDVVGQVTRQQRRLRDRLADVEHVIAVMSGKGGVGKSTVTVNVADALVREGLSVGILDADINGASIPKMTGVRSFTPRAQSSGVAPAIAKSGIRVMSMDLFLPDDTTPVLWDAPSQKGAYTWRPMVEMGALRELLADTEWGRLDVLFVDLAPGGDRLANLADLLPKMSGAVVVTVGSAVSHLVVERSVTMALEVCRVRVLGLVDNMGRYACSRCGHAEALFPSERTSEEVARAHGIPFLGSVPFDPRIATCADFGMSFLEYAPGSSAGDALVNLSKLLYTSLT